MLRNCKQFRIFDWIFLRMVIFILNCILYNTLETPYNAILAVVVMMTAIFLGVKWANWARKKHGSSNYIGRVISTPDLDDIKK
jgi:hypothetical protein